MTFDGRLANQGKANPFSCIICSSVTPQLHIITSPNT